LPILGRIKGPRSFFYVVTKLRLKIASHAGRPVLNVVEETPAILSAGRNCLDSTITIPKAARK
jgi:hypothetical protein